MDAERWQRLSPLLDGMLELEHGARRQALQVLRAEDPAIADELEALLALEDAAEGFLAEPLVAPLPGARPGASVGPYRLERMLGEGGMGQVWLARRNDGLYQRRVALKLLRPGIADPNLRLRFTRERQILARLEHPHIARLLDAGISSDHQPYLALEYVEGEPITDWCQARGLDLDKRLALFLQVCEAVSHAHANLIVHRDLKPSNIMVTALDEVRLLDFGIAKLLDSGDAPLDNTRTGLRTFTLHYAAPEQVRGEPVTTMTDVYSLGVVLYELLTGCTPYRLTRNTDAEWEEAILLAEPLRPSVALQRCTEPAAMRAPALRRRARALSGDLDNIALKALAKAPEQRYPSVEALALDLQRFMAGKPVLARPQSIAYRGRKYVHRHRWALATGVLVAVVLSTALGIVTWQARQAVQEASRAQALQNFVIGLFEHAGASTAQGPLDVRQLLAAGEQRGERELARQPQAHAELLGVIARIRLGMGDHEQALALLGRQSRIVAALNAPPSLRLESVTDLGRAQWLTGRAADCTRTMQPWQALARREQQQLPVQAAEFYSQFGRCLRAVGQRNAARPLFQRALALRRDVLDEPVGVVENLADLAGLRADAGDSSGALQAYVAALDQLRAAAGPRHPLAITLHREMAALHRSLGQPAGAEAAYRSALALAQNVRPQQHPERVALHDALAALLASQGRWAEATAQLQSAGALVLPRLGPRHPLMAERLERQARLALERGELELAARLLANAAAIQRQVPAAVGLSATLAAQAVLRHEAGDRRQADRLLVQSAALRGAGADGRMLGATELLLADQLARQPGPLAARHLVRAAELAARPGAPADATLSTDIALARWQGRNGWPALASARLSALAIAAEAATDRRLHWRARAYLAELRCGGPQRAQAVEGLDAVLAMMRTALPEGGVLPREVAAIRARCARATRTAASLAPGTTAAGRTERQ